MNLSLPAKFLVAILFCVSVGLGHSTLPAQQETPPQAGAGVAEKAGAQEAAGEQEENPAIPPDLNKDFLNPDLDVNQWVERFEVESREVFAGRAAIVEALQLRDSIAVADIGCGTGLFLNALSKKVGEKGTMYAVDISPKFIKHLKQRAESESLGNVQVVLCTDRTTGLKEESIDAALICDTYHHFEYPKQTMKSLYKAMRKDGSLVVVDFERVEGKSRPWTIQHVRAGKDVFRKEIEEAGFRFVEEKKVEEFQENYLLRFTK